jgi:hypothetical protein
MGIRSLRRPGAMHRIFRERATRNHMSEELCRWNGAFTLLAAAAAEYRGYRSSAFAFATPGVEMQHMKVPQ